MGRGGGGGEESNERNLKGHALECVLEYWRWHMSVHVFVRGVCACVRVRVSSSGSAVTVLGLSSSNTCL